MPKMIAYLLVNAPRWNTHAVIAASNVEVITQLKFYAQTANNSSKQWTLVITKEGKAVVVIGSLGNHSDYQLEEKEGWIKLYLPKGRYSLALRYYEVLPGAELPNVVIDDNTELAPQSVDHAVNDFYHNIHTVKCFSFQILNFYIYIILRLKRILPLSFVKREYLPAGNPQTDFLYGALYAGEMLKLNISPMLLASHDIYYTFYDTASLPVLWGRVNEENFVTNPIGCKGVYLIRICQNQFSDNHDPALSSASVFDQTLLSVDTV
jgi:hypothetical protein